MRQTIRARARVRARARSSIRARARTRARARIMLWGFVLEEEINKLRTQFLKEMAEAKSADQVEALRVKYMGKKGPITQLMRFLKDLTPEQRPEAGKWINDLKEEMDQALCSLYETLIVKEEGTRLESEKLDVTLPGHKRFPGRKHIVTSTLDQIIDILGKMGFSVQYGPEIDSDYYNFEALNFSPDHPARDMQDTFYITSNTLLRTHTTNIQVHLLEKERPPIRIIAPGKAYRNETITARSHVFFHQVDGFYIDKGVSFADLLSTMQEFLDKLFGREVRVRYRPSYFPFVEPGMEVDIECLSCDGKGCGLCKQSGWLEIAGAGMIHPEVLKACDVDPEIYTGFAWGMGVERVAMLKHGIRDIRQFWDNDMRFLRQFAGV